MSIEQELNNHFPKKPYSIQSQIASMLYEALDKKTAKLVILESPTGTGKTYSLLVPLIVWLKKNPTNINTFPSNQQKKTVPNWLKKTTDHKGQKLLNQKKKQIANMIDIKDLKQVLKKKRQLKIIKLQQSKKDDLIGEDIQIESESQNNFPNAKKSLNTKVNMMMERQLKIDDVNVLPKLIFVTRTHSQLSQVMQSTKLITSVTDNLKSVQVGSKQHLCINKMINDQKQSINQKCQYLLDHSHCPYYHQLQIKQFFDKNLEESSKLGESNSICSYYASRNLLQYSDIIYLPYSSILNPDIRNRIGININNAIIVFDEGHNVLEFQKQLHSPQILFQDVEILAQQLDEYLKKYRDYLKIKNCNILSHFLEILRALVTVGVKYLKEKDKLNSQKKYLKLDYLQFLVDLNLKQIKIQKIMKYVNLNNVDKKLAYFNSNSKIVMKMDGKYPQSSSLIAVAKINQIINFLLQLTQLKQEKQILMIKWAESKKGSLKILCFQGEQLQKIISKSRMTIIAGGTMQPINDFIHIMTKFEGKVLVKKYSHIIKENQCNISIIKKVNNENIVFNHQNLSNPIANQFFKPHCISIVNKIIQKTEKGGGIVIFIQNYQLLSMFKYIFQNQQYYSRMLFDSKEKKQNSNDDVFKKYSRLVEENKNDNYILVSVMGGKLSEGINFSDRLARSLVVFGLPYPNLYAPQIIQNMLYHDHNRIGDYNGRAYYQNLCNRTLNQTIGRGIRHINDYVNIYLVDNRFELTRIKFNYYRPVLQN